MGYSVVYCRSLFDTNRGMCPRFWRLPHGSLLASTSAPAPASEVVVGVGVGVGVVLGVDI
jgi:hypothetical protein